MTRGRPPKPTQLHVVDGTFNTTRHAARAHAPAGKGKPEKPQGLDEFGEECWNNFVGRAVEIGVGCEIDSVAVAEACRLYSFYRRACAAAALDPVDKEVRCAVTGYWAAFERLASRFGFTPADRLKLVAPKSADSGDPADKHFRSTA